MFIFLKKPIAEDSIEFYKGTTKVGKITNLRKDQNFQELFSFLSAADMEPALLANKYSVLENRSMVTREDFEKFLKSMLKSNSSTFLFRFKVNDEGNFNKNQKIIKQELEQQNYLNF